MATFCLGIFREDRAHIHQSQFQCRLSFHCCCSPQLEALLDAPCPSSTLPAVQRSHQSFSVSCSKTRLSSGGGSSGGGVGGGGNAEPLLLVPPSWELLRTPDSITVGASDARGRLPSPSGRCLLRWRSRLPVPWRHEQNGRVLAPGARAL